MVKIVKHSQVDRPLLEQIVAIKNLSWCYSIEQHTKWINDNLKEDDFHLLIYENNELLAYMNLVNVTIKSRDALIPFLGIGNVCTRHKGKGYGSRLMEEANKYLLDTDKKGLLFCKHHLVDFYLKHDWQLISNLHPDSEINTMVFNPDISVPDLEYNDRLF